jgi:hypothetical protein
MFVKLHQKVLIMLTPQALDCPVVHPINSDWRSLPTVEIRPFFIIIIYNSSSRQLRNVTFVQFNHTLFGTLVELDPT